MGETTEDEKGDEELTEGKQAGEKKRAEKQKCSGRTKVWIKSKRRDGGERLMRRF